MATSLPVIIGTFIASVLFQVIGLSALPMSKGFTNIGPTLVVIFSFAIGMGLLARVANTGVNLSVLIPWLAAVTPMVMIGVGVLFYGEAASPLKIGLLISACIILGIASKVA